MTLLPQRAHFIGLEDVPASKKQEESVFTRSGESATAERP